MKSTTISPVLAAELDAALNPSTVPFTLAFLAGSSFAETRSAVAMHPNTDDETLALLANDFDVYHPNDSAAVAFLARTVQRARGLA